MLGGGTLGCPDIAQVIVGLGPYVGAAFGLSVVLVWLGGLWVRLGRIDRGQCPKCGNDVRTVPQYCPECGTPVPGFRP